MCRGTRPVGQKTPRVRCETVVNVKNLRTFKEAQKNEDLGSAQAQTWSGRCRSYADRMLPHFWHSSDTNVSFAVTHVLPDAAILYRPRDYGSLSQFTAYDEHPVSRVVISSTDTDFGIYG
ncbi:hypothetical protein Y032_0044g1050 [Ancylostoma ceylanicum]|uniref:Uncharacterized protein n=1 Tax=Ancylostoma ceylanicum TaxID=53326 RepID=A0A016UDJ9_9BILA|nr:hypothetical protein Y032_0044g1050 [Ancylostoma ceylanicum]